jgi:hypothetical protein
MMKNKENITVDAQATIVVLKKMKSSTQEKSQQDLLDKYIKYVNDNASNFTRDQILKFQDANDAIKVLVLENFYRSTSVLYQVWLFLNRIFSLPNLGPKLDSLYAHKTKVNAESVGDEIDSIRLELLKNALVYLNKHDKSNPTVKKSAKLQVMEELVQYLQDPQKYVYPAAYANVVDKFQSLQNKRDDLISKNKSAEEIQRILQGDKNELLNYIIDNNIVIRLSPDKKTFVEELKRYLSQSEEELLQLELLSKQYSQIISGYEKLLELQDSRSHEIHSMLLDQKDSYIINPTPLVSDLTKEWADARQALKSLVDVYPKDKQPDLVKQLLSHFNDHKLQKLYSYKEQPKIASDISTTPLNVVKVVAPVPPVTSGDDDILAIINNPSFGNYTQDSSNNWNNDRFYQSTRNTVAGVRSLIEKNNNQEPPVLGK